MRPLMWIVATVSDMRQRQPPDRVGVDLAAPVQRQRHFRDGAEVETATLMHGQRDLRGRVGVAVSHGVGPPVPEDAPLRQPGSSTRNALKPVLYSLVSYFSG